MTDQVAFLSVLFNGPLLRADAIVVLCGEDIEARLQVGVQLLRQDAAPLIVLSGGRDELPRHSSAHTAAPMLMGMGVAHDRILLENESQNTREQAVNIVELAVANGWKRVLLVASAYHMPRAFLTFVQALLDADKRNDLHVVSVTATQVPWSGTPEGAPVDRLSLLRWYEHDKIETHIGSGHCASYEAGLDYLEHWEGR